MQRLLILIGITLLLIGLFWPQLSKLPFGHLPGDIIIRKENFTFYFPLTTMILISLILSGVIYLLRK
ncbi:MAG: DUF2905 domain-containing protein [Calditrichaeota bacterium]|nr:DUF2905 domain-containing protein [Calditrichota bacterium]